MPEPRITDVTDTAFIVAAHRAIETERRDALFRDPLADRLAGERGRAMISALPGSPALSGWSVAIRTCIIDDFIRFGIEQGVDTVLNLGAGLDTRPYRMALPESLRWIEVDYPRMIELKERRLADETPGCRLERVALDHGERPARQELFSRIDAGSRKVLVLTEGVVPYLSLEQAASLADDLRSRPTFRYWIVDYFSPRAHWFRRRAARKRKMENAPFRFRPDDYYAFFAEHGWKPDRIRYTAEEAERLGRPAPLPFLLKWWIRLAAVFAPREKREAFRKFQGYVLFEPAES